MNKFKRRVFDIIQIGQETDLVSRLFDVFIVLTISLNILLMFLGTFDELSKFHGIFHIVETVTIVLFAVEYLLRIWTAEFLYPELNKGRAILRFLFSFDGIVDLLTILPFFFLSGFVAFRMLRVVRILHLFRINKNYDSFNVITSVLYEKRNQILSSVFIIFVLMLASSITMYSVEHEAQPEAFRNAFSGIWWSVSTLLTVGYGDIYPVTLLGRALAIVIAFLGVGVVAIPTGIISAGFVEHYSRLTTLSDGTDEESISFVKIRLKSGDSWIGKKVKDLKLPGGLVIAAIQRDEETVIPSGNVSLRSNDLLILGAEDIPNDQPVDLKRIDIDANHEWNGVMIKDLDISRQSFIVGIKRQGRTRIPTADTVLGKGDEVLLYSKKKSQLGN